MNVFVRRQGSAGSRKANVRRLCLIKANRTVLIYVDESNSYRSLKSIFRGSFRICSQAKLNCVSDKQPLVTIRINP